MNMLEKMYVYKDIHVHTHTHTHTQSGCTGVRDRFSHVPLSQFTDEQMKAGMYIYVCVYVCVYHYRLVFGTLFMLILIHTHTHTYTQIISSLRRSSIRHRGPRGR